MAGYPYENTLTTNSTHQQLIDPRTPFARGTVLSPSRIEEGEEGYDVKHEWAKQLEYQYKRPANDVSDREVERRRNVDCFAFPFDGNQAWTLITRNPIPRAAFYVLPLVDSGSQLGNILNHTVFVDVQGLLVTTRRTGIDLTKFSRLYVSEESNPSAYLKDSNMDWRTRDAYRRIPDIYTYTWSEVAEGIQACHIGVRVRQSGSPTVDFQFRLKQRLDEGIQNYLDPSTQEGSREAIFSTVRELHSTVDDRDEVDDLDDWQIEDDQRSLSSEVLVDVIDGRLERATTPADLISEDAIGCMYEFGDEAGDLSLGT